MSSARGTEDRRGRVITQSSDYFKALRRMKPPERPSSRRWSRVQRGNDSEVPCAQRLAEAGVEGVHIGIYDPNPVIYRAGWKILRDAGLALYDFSADLRDEIAVDNDAFLAKYKTASGDNGIVEFDYALNGRSFTVATAAGSFKIQVSDMGSMGVYVYDYAHHVAHVRHATAFSEIDDPGALEFGSYYAPLYVNQIACYRNEHGYRLVKLIHVDRSQGRHGVRFEYETRGRVTVENK